MFIGIGLGANEVGKTASSAASLNLDFTSSIPAGVTVTTSSTAGYVKNSAGTLQSFTANAGRRTDLGLCIEASRINTHLQASVAGTSHTLITATQVANQYTDPLGTTTADKLIPNNGISSAGISNTTGVSHVAGTYTYSVFVKNQGCNSVGLEVSDGTNGVGSGALNLTTGAITGGDPYSYGTGMTPIAHGVETYANGWFRFYLTYSIGSTLSLQQYVYVQDTGDGTIAIAIWGQQDELGAAPSTHINTTTTQVSRAADNVGFTIPAGIGTLTYTFDDNSTQQVSVSPGAYAIPTTLNRALIKTIVGS